jgi:chromate transporter
MTTEPLPLSTPQAESTDSAAVATSQHAIPFTEGMKVWLRVALLSFGGPAGQIAVMHRILVEEKRWISENRFLHALNYCMLLPGPEAQQLATYIGWLLHRVRGGFFAGGIFVLPGFISILILSILYAGFQNVTLVEGLFYGLKPAVMAIVVEAVIRIGRRALKNNVMVLLAALAFIAIFFFNIPFPLIVVSAGLIGYIGGIRRPDLFAVIRGHQAGQSKIPEAEAVINDSNAPTVLPSGRRALRILMIGLVVWFAPLVMIALTLGVSNVFFQEGLFFSQAAVVTFGGAYAVLAYIGQQAVSVYGWLLPGEMLDGLGMAETTPGPLIQVVQFVGFMGAYRNPGMFDPLVAGILGSILTTWVTYVPCFLWIFLGAPYIEYLRGNRLITSALSTITASVVGVILNLAVWFSLHTLFGTVNEQYVGPLRLYVPDGSTLDVVALLIAIGAFIALFRLKLSMLTTLGISAVLGILYFLLTIP